MSHAGLFRDGGGSGLRRSSAKVVNPIRTGTFAVGVKPRFVQSGTDMNSLGHWMPNNGNGESKRVGKRGEVATPGCRRSGAGVVSSKQAALRRSRDNPKYVGSVTDDEDRRPERAIPESGALEPERM